jgi:tetratricopeptide (TPR) repeat protein
MFEFLDGLEHAELEVVPEDAGGEATSDTSENESEDATARSRYELGLAFRQMGMWEEALRELRPALDRVSDRLGALEAAGECLVKVGRPTEAIALLQSKLRADEDAEQVGPLYILGLALQAEGEQVEAREVLARVEAVQPGYRDTADRLSELSL